MMAYMCIFAKSKYNLRCFYRRQVLSFTSLLFMAILFSSLFISEINGTTVASNVIVGSEAELLKAIEAAPDNTEYVIGLRKNIVLGNMLEIPVGKNITLVSVGGFWTLGSTVYACSIISVAGVLTIDGICVTYVWPEDGILNANVVYVKSGGTFILVDGKLSKGALDGKGGGVNNYGTFVMLGGEISRNGAFTGGGVFNGGNFTMSGGKISNNSAGQGNGVYNFGNFTMTGGEIVDNGSGIDGSGVYNTGNAYDTVGVYSGHGTFEWIGGVIRNNASDGYDDVYYAGRESQDDGLFGGGNWWVYLLSIGFVISFVVGLLFYLSKKKLPEMANGGLLSLCGRR